MDERYRFYTALADKYAARVNDAYDRIWANPEVGYKEWKTTAFLEEEFEKLGYTLTRAGDIPGFTAELDTGRPGPTIAIMGELDSLICATHPDADPETKAVHACGHCAQTASMLGVAAVLKAPGALDGLSGKVRFAAVPAEETIDLDFRNGLVKEGRIRYMAGKIEFLRRGLLDGIDMLMLIHAEGREDVLFRFVDGCNGCITKHFEYQGVAAHAGGEPHKGINALYAASVGMQACNSIRETFRDQDRVRWHPIISQAGVAANAIPDLAMMDAYVRASTLDCMLETNRRINRCLAGAAAAMGANVLITDRPGNLPLHCDRLMMEKSEEIITEIFGPGKIAHDGWNTGSTDLGDMSSLIPTFQPYCGGFTGNKHGSDFRIHDREMGLINPVKLISCFVYEALKDDAALGRQIVEEYAPLFASREEYFRAIDSIASSKTHVRYEEGQAVITY